MPRVRPPVSVRASRGFTLLEVVIALTLIMLVTAIAVPALTGSGATELRDAAGRIAAGLRQAREHALNSQIPAALLVDVERRQFTVTGQQSARTLPQRIALSLYTAQSELEGDGRGNIRFFPDGSSTGGRVTLTYEEMSYYVDVDWLTGQVKVRKGEPPREKGTRRGRVLVE